MSGALFDIGLHRTMHAQLVQVLGSHIVSARFLPGEALPPEPILCEQLGISRGALRETMKALAAKGLVEIRPRTGTRVRPREEWNLLDADVLDWCCAVDANGLALQLVEVRQLVEPGAAAYAAVRASEAERAELLNAFQAMEQAAARDRDAFTFADLEFHRTVLRLSHNPLLISLSKPIERALRTAFEVSSAAEGAIGHTLPLHSSVALAISKSHAVEAENAMRRLIRTFAENYQLAIRERTLSRENRLTPIAPLRLAGEEVQVDVHPDRGGKVSSIRDRRTDHEWLAQTDRSWRATRLWQDSDRCGWDECMPNIAAGRHPDTGADLPDHGEAWSRPWSMNGSTLSVRTQMLDFARTIIVNGAEITAEYSLVNSITRPVRSSWAMHLLLAVNPLSLELDQTVPVRVDSAFGAARRRIGWTEWRVIAEELRHIVEPWAVKLFTAPGAVDMVTATHPLGRLAVCLNNVPRSASFGLWLNAGAWPSDGPDYHVGVEPSFGDHDDFAEAQQSGSLLNLDPGQRLTWQVQLQLEASP